MIRFRYHYPIPDGYSITKPENPLTNISDEDLAELEQKAKDNGCVGLSFVNPSDELKDYWGIDFDHAIIFKYIMSSEILEMEQSKLKAKVLDEEFQESSYSIFNLVDYLRDKGYCADIIHPLHDEISLRAIALEANDCVILRSNMCLFKEGLTVSFFVVATSIENLPIKTKNDMLWAPKFCETCGKCIRRCPHEAYDENEKVLPKKCLAHKEGCSMCMLSCPFYKKGYDKIKERYEKMMKKRNKISK